MATYTKTCSNNSSYTLRLELSESNVNITNNTSVITYALYLDSTYPRFEQWDVSYTLNLGSEVSISRTERLSMPDIRGQPLLLTSGSKTVTHDSNGTKSLSVSCSVSTVTSQSYLPGSASISGYTFVLTTIARKSTLYDVSATIDNEITLNVTRQNSNFTHTITYKFGSSSATIASKSSSLSISWTPPLSLYSQIVGNNSGNGTITIETFNGSASLGSNSYKLTLNAFKIYKTPAISNLRYVRGYTTDGGNWIDYPTSPNIRIKLTTSVVTGIPNNTTDMTVALSNGLTQTRNNISSTDFEIEFDSIGTTTSYTATVTLSDTIGTIKTWSITISTVEVPFDINVNLPGLACGKVAETKKALEFAEGWKLKFGSYPMMDFVVEQGTSGGWTYQKYASGYADLWWRGDVTPTSYTNEGSMVYTNILNLTMPFGVTGNVVVTGTCDNLHILCNTGWDFANKTVSFRLLRVAALKLGPQTVSLRVTGKWSTG